MTSRLGSSVLCTLCRSSRLLRRPISSQFTWYELNDNLHITSTYDCESDIRQVQKRVISLSLRHNAKHRKEPHAKYNPQDLEHDPSTKTDTQRGFDFSTLESDILKSIERMTHRLAELRAGGRLNPTTLEALQIHLDKSSSSRVKLKDIAQVVSKGQYLHVILSDEEV
jgi:ribosome recycling factor